MKVDIEIGGGAKPLDERHGAGLSLGMGQAGLVNHEGREGPVNHLQHGREQVRLIGEQMSARDRKRDHSLAHGHVRNHLLHQMGGSLGHPASPTPGKTRGVYRKTPPASHGRSPHTAGAETRALRFHTPEMPRTRL